jgi:hypothetical protein
LWTFGGSVFLLFLSELGLPKGQIGIMLSFFPFSGLLALVFAPVCHPPGAKKESFWPVMAGATIVIITLTATALDSGQARRAGGRDCVCVCGSCWLVAILRALGETAYFPWSQEFIPNSVRGLLQRHLQRAEHLCFGRGLAGGGFRSRFWERAWTATCG